MPVLQWLAETFFTFATVSIIISEAGMTKQAKATAIGFCAIVLWSSIVGLIKEVSHSFGATAGAALIYTVASVFLLLSVKWVPLRKCPRNYLILGALLMVS